MLEIDISFYQMISLPTFMGNDISMANAVAQSVGHTEECFVNMSEGFSASPAYYLCFRIALFPCVCVPTYNGMNTASEE